MREYKAMDLHRGSSGSRLIISLLIVKGLFLIFLLENNFQVMIPVHKFVPLSLSFSRIDLNEKLDTPELS
jgi:hypothetical protein